jgi:hypothetical protein
VNRGMMDWPPLSADFSDVITGNDDTPRFKIALPARQKTILHTAEHKNGNVACCPCTKETEFHCKTAI